MSSEKNYNSGKFNCKCKCKDRKGYNYTIFGAGPSGLYTVWRLITSGKITKNDKVKLYEWADYDFIENIENIDNTDNIVNTDNKRQPAGRICTYYYNNDKTSSHIEIGGMRYIHWDGSNDALSPGHRLLTTTINKIGLSNDVVDFLTTENPLYYLREKHFYASDITSGNTKAPYNTSLNDQLPYTIFGNVSNDILGSNNPNPITRAEQCEYYSKGKIENGFNSEIYKAGFNVGNIGYWNIFYDQVGNEAYDYADAGGGYDSNIINWNAANAAIYNSEFAPGGSFKTINGGFSRIFVRLYNIIIEEAKKRNIKFIFKANTRLHSIWLEKNKPTYNLASAEQYNKPLYKEYTDFAFLAMPPQSIELIAAASHYNDSGKNINYFLNDPSVTYLLESVIKQPSYKVAMFFNEPWWLNAPYYPKLVNDGNVANVFGPTVTDLPIRQVYYFGDNSKTNNGKVYGILAAYNDISNVTFWRTMELGDEYRKKALSTDFQPLEGGRKPSNEMVQMILKQLGEIHYGNLNSNIPEPLETVYMDWGLNPFGAGYHAWASHYNIPDVMNRIRNFDGIKNIFLTGSAFSDDQAWIEGAFCTAESVLVDFFNVDPIIDISDYPLICK